MSIGIVAALLGVKEGRSCAIKCYNIVMMDALTSPRDRECAWDNIIPTTDEKLGRDTNISLFLGAFKMGGTGSLKPESVLKGYLPRSQNGQMSTEFGTGDIRMGRDS